MSNTGKSDEYKAPVKKADTGRELTNTIKESIDNIRKSKDEVTKKEK